MAMRGRPCGRRRLTRPAKLRKRIISPPRHGGKASVWRDRSATRALPGRCSVSATWVRSAERRHAGASRTGRGASTDRRIVVHCSSLLFAPAECRADPHKAARRKAKSVPWVRRRHCYFIVINNGRPVHLLPSSRCQTARSAVASPRVSLARTARDRRPLRIISGRPISDCESLWHNYVT